MNAPAEPSAHGAPSAPEDSAGEAEERPAFDSMSVPKGSLEDDPIQCNNGGF